MIELKRNNQRNLYEYDVLRIFENRQEALEYAEMKSITDVSL
jgi:hypothetical protein